MILISARYNSKCCNRNFGNIYCDFNEQFEMVRITFPLCYRFKDGLGINADLHDPDVTETCYVGMVPTSRPIMVNSGCRIRALKLNCQSGTHFRFNLVDLVFQFIDGAIYLVSSFQINEQRILRQRM